eukprot:NODE_557_length_6097_cov_0.482161.p2 type:complete len:379 gc:universal NODE_557_length_6097_cov_0.482161:5741-4605(-)
MDEHLSYELSLLNIDFNDSGTAMQDLLNLVKQYRQQVNIVHDQLTKLDGEYSQLQQSHNYLQTEHQQVQSQFNQLTLQYGKIYHELELSQNLISQIKKQEQSVRQDMNFLKSKTSSDSKRKDIEFGKVKDMTIKSMKLNVRKESEIYFSPTYKNYLGQTHLENVPDAYQEYIDMLNDRNTYLKEELSFYKSLYKGVLFELPSEFETKDPQEVINELVQKLNLQTERKFDNSMISKIIEEQNRLLDLATSAQFQQPYYAETNPAQAVDEILFSKSEYITERENMERERNRLAEDMNQIARERMELRHMIRQEEKNRIQFMMNLTKTPVATPYKSTPNRNIPFMEDYSTPLANKSHKTIPFDHIHKSSIQKESRNFTTPK